uniref:Uncharacterized protein n=1 Tax=viral metagenome TaxID=1070528 RepID=A0A6C0CCM0_9ZZZZ
MLLRRIEICMLIQRIIEDACNVAARIVICRRFCMLIQWIVEDTCNVAAKDCNL